MDGANEGLRPDLGVSGCLGQFDAPLLSNVLIWLDGFDIAMLWFTGDRKIRYLMSEGHAVTRFVTNFENHDHPLRIAYPSVVDSFLGLKILEFGPTRFKAIDIPHLNPSKTLESLKCENLQFLGFSALLRSSAADFPNLRNLAIKSTPWSRGELKLLPETLETLECGLLDNATDIAFMPSNLTSLSIRAKSLGSALQGFPQGLTKLIISVSEPYGVDNPVHLSPFLASLPRHLTHFEVMGAARICDCFLAVPPSLTHLKLHTVDVAGQAPALLGLKLLVPHLTHLNLNFNPAVSPAIVAHLSPNLQYVSILPLRGPPQFGTSYPPSATFIDLPDSFGAAANPSDLAQFVSLLPSMLTELRLPFVPSAVWTSETMQSVPRPITTLAVDITDEAVLQFLPPQLTRLELGSFKLPRFGDPFPCHLISQSALELLPISLKELTMTSLSVPALHCGWASRLTQLRTLLITGRQPAPEPSDFASLAPTITSLRLNIGSTPRTDQPNFPGKEAWITAMSHFAGFSEFLVNCVYCDPDMLYGLQRRNVLRPSPLRQLLLLGVDVARPLTDDHLAPPLLKLLQVLNITGASICTEKSLEYLPCISSPTLPKSRLISDAARLDLQDRGRLVNFV